LVAGTASIKTVENKGLFHLEYKPTFELVFFLASNYSSFNRFYFNFSVLRYMKYILLIWQVEFTAG
jgi:hypothetical protein